MTTSRDFGTAPGTWRLVPVVVPVVMAPLVVPVVMVMPGHWPEITNQCSRRETPGRHGPPPGVSSTRETETETTNGRPREMLPVSRRPGDGTASQRRSSHGRDDGCWEPGGGGGREQVGDSDSGRQCRADTVISKSRSAMARSDGTGSGTLDRLGAVQWCALIGRDRFEEL